MRDWKSILGVLLVFALGIVAGVMLSFILVHHRVTTLLKRGSPAYEQLLERRLSHGLHLDPGQREHFHDALVANIEERKKLQAQLEPQTQAINEQTRQQIWAIFTPEQLQQFRHNMMEFRRRFGPPGLGGRAMNEISSAPMTTNAAPAQAGTNSPPGQP